MLENSDYARHEEKRKCFEPLELSSAWAPSIMRSVANWNQSLITNNKQVSCVNVFIRYLLYHYNTDWDQITFMWRYEMYRVMQEVFNVCDLSDDIGIFRLARWWKVRVDWGECHEVFKLLYSRSFAWIGLHRVLPRSAGGGAPCLGFKRLTFGGVCGYWRGRGGVEYLDRSRVDGLHFMNFGNIVNVFLDDGKLMIVMLIVMMMPRLEILDVTHWLRHRELLPRPPGE